MRLTGVFACLALCLYGATAATGATPDQANPALAASPRPPPPPKPAPPLTASSGPTATLGADEQRGVSSRQVAERVQSARQRAVNVTAAAAAAAAAAPPPSALAAGTTLLPFLTPGSPAASTVPDDPVGAGGLLGALQAADARAALRALVGPERADALIQAAAGAARQDASAGGGAAGAADDDTAARPAITSGRRPASDPVTALSKATAAALRSFAGQSGNGDGGQPASLPAPADLVAAAGQAQPGLPAVDPRTAAAVGGTAAGVVLAAAAAGRVASAAAGRGGGEEPHRHQSWAVARPLPRPQHAEFAATNTDWATAVGRQVGAAARAAAEAAAGGEGGGGGLPAPRLLPLPGGGGDDDTASDLAHQAGRAAAAAARAAFFDAGD